MFQYFPSHSLTCLEKVFTTSLNRHEHTNIQATGNNKNKTGDVTHSAATNIFRVVPGTVVGITWTLKKRFLVQLPIFRFPHLLTVWPHSWTLTVLHTIYATCEYFMRDIGIKLFVLAALKEH